MPTMQAQAGRPGTTAGCSWCGRGQKAGSEARPCLCWQMGTVAVLRVPVLSGLWRQRPLLYSPISGASIQIKKTTCLPGCLAANPPSLPAAPRLPVRLALPPSTCLPA